MLVPQVKRKEAAPKTQRRSYRLPAWCDAALRALAVAWIAFTAIPIRFHPVAPDLDASWAFALHDAAAKGLVHGRDIAFTYGPLGYLLVPMDVGSHLAAGIAVQCGIWLLFSGLVTWLAFGRRVGLVPLVLLGCAVAAGIDVVYRFGYAGPDMFCGFMVLLLLGCATSGRRWRWFYGAAVVLAAVLFLVKFSSGILAFSAVVGFAAAMLAVDRRKGVQAGAMALIGTPVLFAACNVIYDPSLARVGRYARIAMEISSGYSAAMSLEASNNDVQMAVLLAGGFALLAAVLWWQKQAAFPLAVACAGPLFLTFKHSIVRPAGHSEIFFQFVPLVAGAVLAFTEFRKRGWWAPAAAAAILCATWVAHGTAALASPLANSGQLRAVTQFAETRGALKAQSEAALAPDRLPAEMLARIGAAPVTILPVECAYAAANPLNYRPIPIPQTYQAYTAYLDEWAAGFFRDAARAPEYVIFDWYAIDGRNPLLDVPAVALELYRHYNLDGVFGKHALLKRRAAPRFGNLRAIGTRTVHAGQPIGLPPHPHPLIARLHLVTNVAGRLRDFFYRVPEVTAVFSAENGAGFAARVPPAVVSNGLPVNFTPADFAGARGLFTTNRGTDMTAITLGGPGLSSFADDVAVELFDIPDVSLAPAPAQDAQEGVKSEESRMVKIVTVNSHGALDYSSSEVMDVNSASGYLLFEGWAVDGDGPAGSVFLEVDGKPCPAQYGIPSPGTAAVYHNPAYARAGFQLTAPAWRFCSGVHEARVRVISRDGRHWWRSTQRLRFRATR